MSGRSSAMRLLAVPFLIMLAILIVWPLASVVRDSFYAGGVPSFANYSTVLANAFYLQSFVTTFGISVITTLVGLILGFFIATALRASPDGVRWTAMGFANVGANFAGVPLAMSIIFLFGLNGIFTIALSLLGLVDEFNVYSFAGLIIAYCYFQIALATLLITPALDAVGRDLEEAAELIGASKMRFWFRVGLPTASRQLIAIAILLFANAMGTFATTFALTGTSINLVTIRISELVSGDIFSDPNLANAIAICLLLILLIPITISQIAAGEKR